MTPYSKKIEIANYFTKDAARTKDWRITTKQGKAFKALAVKMVEEGKCYIIATPKELEDMHPDLYKAKKNAPDQDTKYIWSIFTFLYGGKYVRFGFGTI